jgi:WhiB family redox-sensing transcriptional regulator
VKNRPLCASPHVDPGLWFAGPEATGRAKAICAACPAISECLDLALGWHPVEGIWGGTTIGERVRIIDDRASARWSLPAAVGARR